MDLSGKCRVPLASLEKNPDSDMWHLLFEKEFGRVNHSRINVTIQRGPLSSREKGESRDSHPMFSVNIPYAINFDYLSAKDKFAPEISMTRVFPPASPLFHRLFLTSYSLDDVDPLTGDLFNGFDPMGTRYPSPNPNSNGSECHNEHYYQTHGSSCLNLAQSAYVAKLGLDMSYFSRTENVRSLPLASRVLPVSEVLLEAIGKIWLRLPGKS